MSEHNNDKRMRPLIPKARPGATTTSRRPPTRSKTEGEELSCEQNKPCLGPFSCPYSPECVEVEFCELRLYGVLGSWHSSGPSLAPYDGRMPRLPCLMPGSAQSRLLLFHLLQR